MPLDVKFVKKSLGILDDIDALLLFHTNAANAVAYSEGVLGGLSTPLFQCAISITLIIQKPLFVN